MSDFRTTTRRSFVLASALGGISGCGPVSFDPGAIFGSSSAAIRVVSPWHHELRDRFGTALAEWGKNSGLGPIRIDWFPVRDDDLAPESVFRLLRFADLILGGRHHDPLVRDSAMLAHARLAPLRVPVIRSISSASATTEIPPPTAFAGDRQGPSLETARRAVDGLLLHDQPFAPVEQAYFLALFEDAPDQAAGYARWIRLAGSSRPFAGGPATAKGPQLALADIGQLDRSAEKPWNGGPGTTRILAISDSDPIHWPESAVWRASAGPNKDLSQILDFCRETGWLAPQESPNQSRPSTGIIHSMMADIVRVDCVSVIRRAWQALNAAGLEIRPEVETYLTARPPWPPASILKLRQERGFEYVAALVEQLSDDTTQRNWLIREFSEPVSDIDFRRLESAELGDLSRSIRFRGWLRAEWVAWINQRCRRAERYIADPPRESLDESAPPRPEGPRRS